MGRQLSLQTHCLLCIKEIDVTARNWEHNNAKAVYERNGTQGFTPVGRICRDCLGYLRGGNWPTDVYAKLSGAPKGEGERAAERLLTA
jgi:hypothetical protein